MSCRFAKTVTLYFHIGDQSASSNCDQSQIDKRIMQLIDMEDSDIVCDLRAFNGSRRSQYDQFWDECQNFLSEDLTDAVDDRRHGMITHLSRAVSIRDFVRQVCCYFCCFMLFVEVTGHVPS